MRHQLPNACLIMQSLSPKKKCFKVGFHIVLHISLNAPRTLTNYIPLLGMI